MKQHSPGFVSLVSAAKKNVKEISAQTLKKMIDQKQSFYLIDVREDSEWANGAIPSSIHLSKGVIERDIEKNIADYNKPIVVYCSGGFRSALVADNLQKMGYTDIHSLSGGSTAWGEAGYALGPKVRDK